MYLIALYLTAVIFANLTTAAFGPSWSIINALLFIGLDLTSRDQLHERWHGRHLWRNMALLIATGSLLSMALNWQAAPIALASLVAFAGAGIADTVVYSLLGDRSRMVKINGSNVVSAAVDSVLFPALAFGFPLAFGVMIGQFVAKVGGGFIWSWILTNARPPQLARYI